MPFAKQSVKKLSANQPSAFSQKLVVADFILSYIIKKPRQLLRQRSRRSNVNRIAPTHKQWRGQTFAALIAVVAIVGVSLMVPAETVQAATPDSAAAVDGLIAVVRTDNTELQSDDGGVTLLPTATLLRVTGRSADGGRLYAHTDDAAGWVAANHVFAFGIDSLPILDGAPTTVTVSAEPATAVMNVTDSAAVDIEAGETEAIEIATAAAETGTTEATMAVSATDNATTVETVDEASITATIALTSSRLNVRAGPATSYAIIAKAYPDEVYEVLGRNTAGDWIQIIAPNVADGVGWVSAQYVDVSTTVDALSISATVSRAPTLATGSEAVVDTTSNGTTATTAGQSASSAVSAASTAGLTGTLVFQQSNGGTIYAYNLATGALWPLTYGFDPAISPDGSTVAFTRDGGEQGLYLINIDGSNVRRIYAGGEKLAAPKWSPDGNWVLFSYRTAFTEEAQRGRGDTTSEPSLVTAYAYYLAVVDINGEEYHDIVALNSARAPDWTESGIVYQSGDGLQITADATDAENQLVAFNYLDPFYHDPDWQPGGGQIAFMKKGASHWQIYTINPDGSNMVALTRPVTTLVDALPSAAAPAYSPDGQHIVYVSNIGADNSAGDWHLWVMNADGSNQRQLPLDMTVDYTFGDEQLVSWGP